VGCKKATNDNSTALILRYPQVHMLFTDDAGSAYSSSPGFIAAVRPRYAIISVGPNKMFGHRCEKHGHLFQAFFLLLRRRFHDGLLTVASAFGSTG